MEGVSNSVQDDTPDASISPKADDIAEDLHSRLMAETAENAPI